MTQPKGDKGIQARNSLSREASTVPDHPSLSFTEAFKASFAGAAHALPSGYRRVTWARNQEGEAWATIGPYKANFIIGLAEGVILLTDQRSERVLGRWSATNVTGKTVAMLVAEVVAHSSDNNSRSSRGVPVRQTVGPCWRSRPSSGEGGEA